MDPETLVTFLFNASPEVRSVELLGSWDNFTHAYLMHHDRRRGHGFWTGCFKFDNIVFDGLLMTFSRPRSGGLKQGGLYWYYYRLDDRVEAYDDSRQYTADCPLLPGQTVNVIEVPVEVPEPMTRSRSASSLTNPSRCSLERSSSRHTLEPNAKFEPLYPPPPSKVHLRCISDLELGGRPMTHSLTGLSPRLPSPGLDTYSRLSRRLLSSISDSGSACARHGSSQSGESSLRVTPQSSWRDVSDHLVSCSAYRSETREREVASSQESLSPLSSSRDVDEAYHLGPAAGSPKPGLCPRRSSTSYSRDSRKDIEGLSRCSIDNSIIRCGSLVGTDDETSLLSRIGGEEPESWDPETVVRDPIHDAEPTDNLASTSPGPFRSPSVCGIDDVNHAQRSPFELSPTFSAATMSSKGIQTPLRLSNGFVRATTISPHAQLDASTETICVELDRLDMQTRSTSVTATPAVHNEIDGRFEIQTLRSASLCASESSLPFKLPFFDSYSTTIQTLPPVPRESTAGLSMAEAIFSEVGF